MRIALGLAMAASLCFGQEFMPQPAPEMKALHSLVGTWDVSEEHDPSEWMPQGMKNKGVAVFQKGPGGHSVLMNYTSTNDAFTFEGHGLMTWDAAEKAYRTHWADVMTPGVTVSTGKKEGDTIVQHSEVTLMGQKMKIKEVMSEMKEGAFTTTSYQVTPQGEKRMMVFRYTKRK